MVSKDIQKLTRNKINLDQYELKIRSDCMRNGVSLQNYAKHRFAMATREQDSCNQIFTEDTETKPQI